MNTPLNDAPMIAWKPNDRPVDKDEYVEIQWSDKPPGKISSHKASSVNWWHPALQSYRISARHTRANTPEPDAAQGAMHDKQIVDMAGGYSYTCGLGRVFKGDADLVRFVRQLPLQQSINAVQQADRIAGAGKQIDAASVQADAQDAQRYRWLRTRPGQIGMALWPHAPWSQEDFTACQDRLELCVDEERIEAIDAALQSAGDNGEKP